MSRPVRLTALTAALLVLPATAAWAHPGFDPSAIPAGEPVETTLNVAHGCAPGGGAPDDDGGEVLPTTLFALDHTEQVRVEASDIDGWEVTDDGDAIVWTADGGAEPAPSFPMTITVTTGTTGETVYLDAYQECDTGDTTQSFRWIARPGEEGDPALKLELTSTATPPPEATTSPDDAVTTPATTPTDGEASPTSAATPEPADTPTDVVDEDVAAPLEDSGGVDPALIAAVVIIVGAAVGAAIWARRRGQG